MNIENVIIVILISAFVLMFYAKIKSKYDEKAYRRDLNRRYRLKYDVQIRIKNREKIA